jgi:hypothetical protein
MLPLRHGLGGCDTLSGSGSGGLDGADGRDEVRQSDVDSSGCDDDNAKVGEWRGRPDKSRNETKQ